MEERLRALPKTVHTGGKHGTGAGKLISPGTRMPQVALVVLINWHRMAPRRSCGELLELKRGT